MQGGGPKRIRNGYSEARQRRRRAFFWAPVATLFWAVLGVAPPRRIDLDTPRRCSLMPAQNSVVAGSLGFEIASNQQRLAVQIVQRQRHAASGQIIIDPLKD